MPALIQWVKKAVEKFLDPEKEQRVQRLAIVLHQQLQTHRDKFSLATVVRGLDPSPTELETAKERVYRTILARAWADENLTAAEQQTIQWVAHALELNEQKARQINLQFAKEYFAVALAQAMQDGVLEQHEELRLARIAASVGCSLPQFARAFFSNEGEAFLRGIFMVCVADGKLAKTEWNYLLTMAQKFGFQREEFLQVIQPQAELFVEQVLANAKADGRLSPHEESVLCWLLGNLSVSPAFKFYVDQELGLLRTLTEIEDGRLPVLPAPRAIELRAGEIVHFHAPAVWQYVRMSRGKQMLEDHRGTITLTDNRLIFSSPTKSQSLGYRKIVSHWGRGNSIRIEVEGKPSSTFFILEDAPLAYPVFSAAVAMANQTRIARTDEKPSRHIPRDVRQRVWQRYGGRCAECGANDYLEFDHIIPVARGGSNSENNIQLLCRRCNLKKSDSI